MLSYPPLSWPAADLPGLLRPAIEKYRDEADELRVIPEALLTELRCAGAFRLSTPRELGGFELPVASTLDLLEQLARLDGPVAWVIWNLNLGFSAAALSQPAVDRIWAAGPDPVIAHSAQPGRLLPVGDNYRLSGEWKIVSGAESAEWLLLMALVMDGGHPRTTEGGPDVRFCCVPRESVTVRDTWHVAGMRGTNSNTVLAGEVDVPAEMTMPVAPVPRIDRPLYRVPAVHLVFPGCAAVVLGMAGAAVEEMAALSRTKVGMDGVRADQQPRLQAALGRSAASLGAARAWLLAAAGVLDAAAAAGRPATDAERGALRGAVCHAGETARAVLASMYEAGGSASLYQSSRLGRICRDGQAAAQHANLSPAHYELAGRTLLGLPADAFFV
jgi:alkylation response protein AidB-like acyl-CoA dehydrogenase